MRVKLKTSVSGPAGSWSPGIRDLPDELADEMLEAGFAELIDAQGEKVDPAGEGLQTSAKSNEADSGAAAAAQIEKGDPAGEGLQTSAKSNEADSGAAAAAQIEKGDPAAGAKQSGAQKGGHSGKGYFKRG